MKQGIHPTYHESVEIRCSCGNVIYAGSTKEVLRTELCSKCHPFYTGQQKLIDTAGRIDRFEAKRKAAQLHKEAKHAHELAKKVKKTEIQKEKIEKIKKEAKMRAEELKERKTKKAVPKKKSKK